MVLSWPAYKHVNMIEDNPLVGLKNNVVGTFNLVDAAIKYHCDNFIFI